MARNEWSRWGRGDCEGYGLDIGYAYARFNASVVRGLREDDGSYKWAASINGGYRKTFDTRAEAMAHIEFELSIEGERFASEYAGYKAHRHENKFSQAVDAMRKAKLSNSVNSNGAA
jgi:hypothetical protein